MKAGNGLAELRQVVYDDEQWRLLREFRARALRVMEAIAPLGFSPIVYGSVVRGDVKRTSDLDIFIPQTAPTQLLELALANAGYEPVRRVLVQATPSHAVKAYIYLSETDTVSVPLTSLTRDELGFYQLAGSLELEELRRGLRRPGINKQLMVIAPTEYGHLEFPATRNVDEAAKTLQVSPEILRNRIRVLTRRREVGRTGVYRSIELTPGQSFEEVFERLLAENPALRRRVRRSLA